MKGFFHLERPRRAISHGICDTHERAIKGKKSYMLKKKGEDPAPRTRKRFVVE